MSADADEVVMRRIVNKSVRFWIDEDNKKNVYVEFKRYNGAYCLVPYGDEYFLAFLGHQYREQTKEHILPKCGKTAFPCVFKAFRPFSLQNQKVVRTACSTVSTPTFPVVGQDVGQENEHDVPQKNDTSGESGSSYLAVNKKSPNSFYNDLRLVLILSVPFKMLFETGELMEHRPILYLFLVSFFKKFKKIGRLARLDWVSSRLPSTKAQFP